MGSALPEGWKQVCTKGHSTDHSTKCTHWICPQGRRYKEWSDVQAYFQLLYFEDDIPGVECRPENAKKIPDADEEEEVTLEEATKKEMEEKANKSKGKTKETKRKRQVIQKESSGSDEEAEEVVKKKGKKKNADDDDYQPDAESVETVKKSPKKTRRSVAAAKSDVKESFKCNQCKSVFLSNNDLQNHLKTNHKKDKETVNTTLEETPDIPKKAEQAATVPTSKKPDQGVPTSKKPDQGVPMSKKPDLGVTTSKKPDQGVPTSKKPDQVVPSSKTPGYQEADKKTNSDVDAVKVIKSVPEDAAKKSARVVNGKKSDQDTVTAVNVKKSDQVLKNEKSQLAAKPEQVVKAKLVVDVSEIINLDSPTKEVKEIKTKPVVKDKPPVTRSVSIVKIDDDIQEVKIAATAQVEIKEDVIKSSTQKMYDSRFEVFKEYCVKAGGEVDPMKAAPAILDKFLQQLQKEKNLGKSVLSGYKSAILKIQSEHKSQAADVEAAKPATQPSASKPPVAPKPVATRATITPVEQKPSTQPAAKAGQATAAKSTVSQPQSAAQPKAAPAQRQGSRGRPAAAAQQTQSRDSTPQGKPAAASSNKTPQSQQKQSATTPQSQPRAVAQNAVRQQTPVAAPRLQTPQSIPRQQTPQSGQRQQVPPAGVRQTPQAVTRQTTPQSGARQQTPQPQAVRQLSQSGTPRAQGPRAQTTKVSTPRQAGPQVRGIQPSAQPRQGTPQPRQQPPQARQQTPQARQQRPQQARNTPQPRQQQPGQPRQQLAKNTAAASAQAQPKLPQFTELPAYLKSLVSFPCKLETNAGGGPSLYRAAAQHTGLGQDGWQELRRYCHDKLLEWWQWYQPYYTFPLQVKLRMRNQTVQKTVPSSTEFQKFLKSDESLNSFHMSECELYCLANILGVPIYQLSYNLVGVAGKPEERCRWDTLDPHHGLIHQNKFASNKDPLYILYEDKVHFCKIVQIK